MPISPTPATAKSDNGLGPTGKPGSNAWGGWEIMVLNDLGAPTTGDGGKANIEFLDLWQTFERSTARNNPLNLTAPTGYAQINSANVQSYATPQEGAKFTADNIRRYSTIYSMLKTGHVKQTLLGSTGIIGGFHLSPASHLVSDLRKWGSGNFADYLSGGLSTADKTATAVAAPFHDLASAWNWVGNNWERVLFVLGGTIIAIIAIIYIAKKQTLGSIGGGI